MNTKKPNFIIISGSGDTFVWFRLELLSAIQRKGYKVYALAPEISYKNQAILEERGINFLRINLKRKSFNLLNFIQSCIELNKIFNELKPEIVLGYMHKSILASCIVSFFHKNIKIFSMITGLGHLFERQSLKYTILKKVFGIFFKISFKRASKVFFQNPDDKKFFERSNLLNPDKAILVNGSGVNTKEFSYSEIPDKTVFMTMARLLESKGLREFAESAKVVKEKFPETRFIIYGYPDKHSDSISEKEILNLWPEKYGTEYLGYTEEPSSAYDAASVFVLLSYREGVPRTVLEAMAKSRPIITTDVPGCRETVVDGLNGYLVPPRNSIKASEAMINLVDRNKQIFMGTKSRSIAEEKFDVRKVNEVILKEVLNKT